MSPETAMLPLFLIGLPVLVAFRGASVLAVAMAACLPPTLGAVAHWGWLYLDGAFGLFAFVPDRGGAHPALTAAPFWVDARAWEWTISALGWFALCLCLTRLAPRRTRRRDLWLGAAVLLSTAYVLIHRAGISLIDMAQIERFQLIVGWVSTGTLVAWLATLLGLVLVSRPDRYP